MMNYLGGVLRRREVLHQAEGQRAGHPPDERADPAGAHQRPDQAGAGAELRRRSGRRSATRSSSSSTSTRSPCCPAPSASTPRPRRPSRPRPRSSSTFVLSPAGQKVMQSGDPTGDSLYYPVVQGVAPLAALPPLTGVKTQIIDPYTWGTQGGRDQHLVRQQHRPLMCPADRACRRRPGQPAGADGAGGGPGWPGGRPLACRPRVIWAGPVFWLLLMLLHPGPLRLLPAARRLAAAVRPGAAVVHADLPAARPSPARRAVAIVNSLWVSTAAAAAFGLAIGFPIAWLAARTTLPGRRLVAGGMWLVLLLPSWLPALGWQRLVQPDGVMYRVGLGSARGSPTPIMGPFGVVLLLGLRSRAVHLPGHHRRAGRASARSSRTPPGCTAPAGRRRCG